MADGAPAFQGSDRRPYWIFHGDIEVLRARTSQNRCSRRAWPNSGRSVLVMRSVCASDPRMIDSWPSAPRIEKILIEGGIPYQPSVEAVSYTRRLFQGANEHGERAT